MQPEVTSVSLPASSEQTDIDNCSLAAEGAKMEESTPQLRQNTARQVKAESLNPQAKPRKTITSGTGGKKKKQKDRTPAQIQFEKCLRNNAKMLRFVLKIQGMARKMSIHHATLVVRRDVRPVDRYICFFASKWKVIHTDNELTP